MLYESVFKHLRFGWHKDSWGKRADSFSEAMDFDCASLTPLLLLSLPVNRFNGYSIWYFGYVFAVLMLRATASFALKS